MTSAPVTASVKSYFTGTQTAATSEKRDVENSFSDVFQNQKSDTKKMEPEREAAALARAESRADRVSEKPVSVKSEKAAELTPEETIEYAEKAAEEMAAEMVKKAAEVLGISEAEVLGLLEGLGMTAENLLTTDGLQALVLAAAGEGDVSSFMTDEQLFSNFRELQQLLENAVTDAAEAAGLEATELRGIFEKLAKETDRAALAEDTEMSAVTEIAGNTEIVNAAEEEEVKQPQTISGNEDSTGDGSAVMLERSLAEKEAGNADAGQFAQESNPFAQTAQIVHNMANAVNGVSEAQSYFDTDTEMIMRQITEYMRSSVSEGVSELEMQLHPESLGSLHVKLTAKEGAVTAQFTAQNEAVKNVLESQMIQLKETFKEQGVTVENIEVEVQTNGFEHSLGQNGGGQTQNSGEQANRPKTRRINLDNLETAAEEMTEEEKLAAEMLKESGNTVDYTA